MELSLTKIRNIFIFTIAIFVMSCSCALCTNVSQYEKKTQIDAQMGHAKKEIKKLKLLEKIETNRLYKNQQKLEYTQYSLQKNKKEYSSAKNEVISLEKKLDVLLAEHRRHLQYTSKRIVQIFKHKRNNYIEFLLNSEDINAFLDRLYFENIIISNYRVPDRTM